jgi:hypothetical protein
VVENQSFKMQTIFEQITYDQLVTRIGKVEETMQPLWGKMNSAQMMHHLNLTMEAPLGKYIPKGKPLFFMRPFRSVLYNDKPFGKGDPTPKDFKIKGDFNFAEEKEKAINLVGEIFRHGISGSFKSHVFFGSLTGEQWGRHFYKHTDHHLRQFGV